jgi:hypothetical protein
VAFSLGYLWFLVFLLILLSGLIIVDNPDQAYLAANREIFDSYSNRYAFLRYLATEENVGSAGGFLRGMEIVRKNGFGGVWLLGQDGTVSLGCLAELLARSEEGGFFCPNMVASINPLLACRGGYSKLWGRCYPAFWCSKSYQIHTFGAHAT